MKRVSGTLREVKRSLAILRKSKRGLLGFSIITLFLLVGFIGPLIVPPDLRVHAEEIYAPPSLKHPLGTDYAGRDIFSLIVNVTSDILSVGFLAGFITTLIGVSVGITSGFKGGKIDSLLMALVDFVLTIPSLPLILVIGVLIRGIVGNIFVLATLLSITRWASLARSVRSRVLALREREFIDAAETLGLSSSHIIFRELLPNISSYIAINFIYAMMGAINGQVGLYFLGVLPYTSINWGVMLNMAMGEGSHMTTYATHYLLAPLVTLVLLQVGMVSLCFGLDEILNPKLRTE